MWYLLEHVGPLCVMGALIFGSQALARRLQDQRSRADAHRLRVALSASLKGLRELYYVNLQSVARAKPHVMSGRQQIALMRTHMGRLTSLAKPEIEAVMAANIAVEGAEMAMAVAGKAIFSAAFTLPAGGEERREVKAALVHAFAALEAAEDLVRSNEGPVVAPHSDPIALDSDSPEVGDHLEIDDLVEPPAKGRKSELTDLTDTSGQRVTRIPRIGR